MSKNWSAVLTALFVALVGFGLSGCGKAPAPAGFGGQAMPVKVAEVKAGTITEASVYTGLVKSRRSVTLSPQVDGQISRIFVQPGEHVLAGRPLLEIAPDRQAASVSSFEAASDTTAQDVHAAKSTLRSLEAQKVAKTSNVKLAQQKLERYSTLWQSGAVSKQEADEKQNALDTAKAELISTEAQIAAQQSTVSKMQKQLDQSSANVRQQKVQLQYYTIRAPFAGTVGDIPVRIGSYVNPQTVLTNVTENRPLEIYVNVPVEKAAQIKMESPIELLDAKGKTFGVSSVFFIAPSVHTETQTVLVKARYDNSGNNLRADQLVNARVIWSQRPGVFVPTTAVSHQSGESFLFLADNSKDGYKAHQIPVKLGEIEGENYQVISGVSAGAKIITSGIQNLADGVPVNPSI